MDDVFSHASFFLRFFCRLLFREFAIMVITAKHCVDIAISLAAA